MTSLYSGLVGNLLRGYFDAGYDLAGALRAAKLEGVPETSSVAEFVRLSRAISLQMNDEYAGQLERPQRIGTLAVMAAHASHGRTAGEGFRRLAEFLNMLDNTFVVSFCETSEHCRFELVRTNPDFPKTEFGVEAVLVLIHQLVAWLSGTSMPLSSVWFDYPRPGWAGEYGRLFPGASLGFSSSSNGFSMPGQFQSLPLCKGEDAARSWARRTPMDAFLPVRLFEGISFKTAGLIGAAIGDGRPLPSMYDLAETLNMPVYTLRRRLRREGHALPDIRLQVKRDHARRLLAETEESIETIAIRLGFSETSAFVRAFKDWIGVTPRTYRQAGSQQNPVQGLQLPK